MRNWHLREQRLLWGWTMPDHRLALWLILCMWLGGCSGLIPHESESRLNQKQRESIAGRTTADVVSESKTRPPTVTIDNGKVKVEVPVEHEERTTARTSAQESADAAETLLDLQTNSVPLFVKLIGGAVGLGLLGFVVFWIVKRIRQGAAGAAAAAAFRAADNRLASIIATLEARAATEKDESARLAIQAQLTALNKERGKLAAEAKGA